MTGNRSSKMEAPNPKEETFIFTHLKNWILRKKRAIFQTIYCTPVSPIATWVRGGEEMGLPFSSIVSRWSNMKIAIHGTSFIRASKQVCIVFLFILQFGNRGIKMTFQWLNRPWDSPGRNTGVGGHFRLQGIFPTQWLNPVSHIAGRRFNLWATKEVRSFYNFQ